MAAAVTLAARGVPVAVFESGPVPGGRARRVKTDGHQLDNGQHILAGAYSELLPLMRLVGVAEDAVLRLPLELRYADGFAFRSLWLPAPLGMLGGLLFNSKLPFPDRVGAIRFMTALRSRKFQVGGDRSVSDLLDQYRQNGVIGHYLWRPLCVSALNTPAGEASAQIFANVLRDSVAGPSGASDLLLPRVDLSRLFPEPACDFVTKRGGEVRLNAPVRDLAALRADFGAVVVAVGPHQLKALLPGIAREYEYQPIYTCYLQYPESARLAFPMLGLADGLVQWAFDRGQLTGERGLIACVISAQGDHQQMAQDELAAACHRELKSAVKSLPEPQWTRVIAEKRATIACTPAMKALELPSLPPSVVLAGDYTDPDYPPTLEAAVRSGVRAAERALSST
jgi:squalene-associated FAD-dependent desaturase